MQSLRNEDIELIENDLIMLKSRYVKLVDRIWKVADVLKNTSAKEYLFHGVARRLDVVERCVENIYLIFPLRRKKLLCRDELKDVDINLHAFFINIFGLLDNMAWVAVYETNESRKINKNGIGLYKAETQEFLGDGFKEYLNTDTMKKWHNEYLKNYRDALSHRIPLYVPPKNLNPEQKEQEEGFDQKLRQAIKSQNFNEMNVLQKEMDKIGDPAPFFMHSLSETDNKIVMLHAQVITDFGTVEEIVEKFCEMFKTEA